jgi:hypothetical protein
MEAVVREQNNEDRPAVPEWSETAFPSVPDDAGFGRGNNKIDARLPGSKKERTIADGTVKTNKSETVLNGEPGIIKSGRGLPGNTEKRPRICERSHRVELLAGFQFLSGRF